MEQSGDKGRVFFGEGPDQWPRLKGVPNDGERTASDHEAAQRDERKEAAADAGTDVRRRRRIRERRRKQRYAKEIARALTAFALFLIVLAVGSGIHALAKRARSEEKTASAGSKAAESQIHTEKTAAKKTDSRTLDGRSLPLQLDVQNKQVEDIWSLDTEMRDFGYGPARDGQNRPLDVLELQASYGQYNAYFIAPTDDKIIYLTFDMGYETGCTKDILDILKETDCPAVFFVLMMYVEESPDMVQRMIDEGHIIGNHSINHTLNIGLPALSLDEQRNEVQTVHDYMLQHYNYKMWLWRFPSGVYSEQSLAVINNMNYQSVFWSFACRDYDEADPMAASDILEAALKALHPGAIYLFHVVNRSNVEMLEDFITEARERGYTFGLFTGDPSVTVTSRAAVAPVKEKD